MNFFVLFFGSQVRFFIFVLRHHSGLGGLKMESVREARLMMGGKAWGVVGGGVKRGGGGRNSFFRNLARRVTRFAADTVGGVPVAPPTSAAGTSEMCVL